MKIRQLLIAVTLGFMLLSLKAKADGPVKNLPALIAEYLALPTSPNELFVENLMNNPMMGRLRARPSASIDTLLGELNIPPVEKIIIKKQYLIGEIYKEAILEVVGPDSAKVLSELFFKGKIPGHSTDKNLRLPKIERMNDGVTLYDLIFLLLQREDGVQVIALDILRSKGRHYPSSDSFGRGLARYAAEAATDGKLFTQILSLFDKLYEVRDRHPLVTGSTFQRYHVNLISHELTEPTYNPAFAKPELREIIIHNMFSHLDIKHAEDLRYDLLRGLASIQNHAAVDKLVEQVLKTSTHPKDLFAVLDGLNKDKSHRYDPIIFDRLSEYAKFKTEARDQRSVVNAAIGILQSPYTSRDNPTHLSREPLMALFQHADPEVRKNSLRGLNWPGFLESDRTAVILAHLEDPNENVRLNALDQFWSVWFNGSLQDYKVKLEEMAAHDPINRVRETAKDAIVELTKKEEAGCKALLAEETDSQIN